MYVIFLRFAENRHLAAEHMAGHNAWIGRGVDDGVFLVVGSVSDGRGGAIIAHGAGRADIEKRLEADPFVAERVVVPDITEIAPGVVDPRLAFVMS
jgi:uncharacterized protein YciI